MALQSPLFSLQPAHFQAFANVRKTLHHSWLSFFDLSPAPLGSLLDREENQAKATVLPLLPKAETLALISGAAAKYRLSAAFVTSIVAAESNFDATAVSSKGAIGLMQLMPDTAKLFGANPQVPAENVDAGTHYLHYLMMRYQNIPRVIAAYNAGPGMVDRYRGVPPFRETRTYLTRVLGFLRQFSRARRT